MTPEQREEVANILETVAKDGLPGPRDLDVALDAIESAMSHPVGDAMVQLEQVAGERYWIASKGRLTAAEPLFAAAIFRPGEDAAICQAEGETLRDVVRGLEAMVPAP